MSFPREMANNNLSLNITEEYGLIPSDLCFELTESTIALDDCDRGYSSLSYLRWLSIDIIKIDLSFMEYMPPCK